MSVLVFRLRCMIGSMRHPAVAALFFMLVVWLITFIGLRWKVGLLSIDAGAAAIQNPNMGDRAAGQWFELSVVIVFLLCALAMPWPAIIGAKLPVLRPMRSSFYAFTWTLLAFAATGYLTALIDSGNRTAEAARDFSVATRARMSVHAGITEETYNLVIPTTVIILLIAGINGFRHTRGFPPISLPSWAVAAACLIGVGTRYVEHLHQGEINAAKHLVLGGLLIGIFVFWRTVWPIAAAHSTFDFILTSSLPATVQAIMLIGIPILLIIICVVALAVQRPPRRWHKTLVNRRR